MNYSQLYTKISILPEDLKSEVNEFVDSLLKRVKRENKKRKPKYGCAKGQIFVSPDFDAPIDDFKEYTE